MIGGKEVMVWAIKNFGLIATNRRERASRVLEEALELAQVEGVEPDVAIAIHHRVYSRPPGDVAREIGQVQMTLTALASNIGLDADDEGQREFERVKSVPQSEWKRRHDAKVALGIASNSEPST